MVHAPGTSKDRMIEQITDWLKFLIVAIPLAVGTVGGAVKFFERFSAVPQLQRDVKRLKRDTRFLVQVVAKAYKVEPPQEHDADE